MQNLLKQANTQSAAPPRQIRRRGQAAAYAFLLPALLAFGIFAWWPILNSILMSFQQVNLIDARQSAWIGFDNYTRMFADPTFAASLTCPPILVPVSELVEI